jgi:hypothetical protein
MKHLSIVIRGIHGQKNIPNLKIDIKYINNYKSALSRKNMFQNMKNETNWIIFLFTCKEIYITAIIVIEISEFKLFGFLISFTTTKSRDSE